MMKMMGKIQEFRQRMQQAQQEIESMRITGESGGGMIKVMVNGKKSLISLEINPVLQDKEIIQDLIIKAVNEANQAADRMAKEHVRKSTEGLLPNIPGLDLNSMIGG